MELIMQTDLGTALPKVIDFNFEQLQEEVKGGLKRYSDVVVTEDTIKEAKADRAALNKLKTAISDKRKEVKKEWLAPYTNFEDKMKTLESLIDEPIAAIDGQLNGFEVSRREKRQTEITESFAELIGDMAEMVPLNKVMKAEWLNATVTMKKVREEIGTIAARVRANLGALNTIESEFQEAVKMKFLETLDLTVALQEHERLKKDAERLRNFEEQQRQKAAEEALKKASEVAFKEGVEEPKTEPAPAPASVMEPEAPITYGGEKGDKIYQLTFACWLTKEQAAGLNAYLNEHNINFRRV